MFGRATPRRYFEVSSVQQMLDEFGPDGKYLPKCLDTGDEENPLDIVFTLSSQTALVLANSLLQGNSNTSAIDAFCTAIYRQVVELPSYEFSTDAFFQIKSAEELIEEVDECDDMGEFMKPQSYPCPLEIVLTMTTKFATSILSLLRQARPVDMMFLLCKELEKKLQTQQVDNVAV